MEIADQPSSAELMLAAMKPEVKRLQFKVLFTAARKKVPGIKNIVLTPGVTAYDVGVATKIFPGAQIFGSEINSEFRTTLSEDPRLSRTVGSIYANRALSQLKEGLQKNEDQEVLPTAVYLDCFSAPTEKNLSHLARVATELQPEVFGFTLAREGFRPSIWSYVPEKVQEARYSDEDFYSALTDQLNSLLVEDLPVAYVPLTQYSYWSRYYRFVSCLYYKVDLESPRCPRPVRFQVPAGPSLPGDWMGENASSFKENFLLALYSQYSSQKDTCEGYWTTTDLSKVVQETGSEEFLGSSPKAIGKILSLRISSLESLVTLQGKRVVLSLERERRYPYSAKYQYFLTIDGERPPRQRRRIIYKRRPPVDEKKLEAARKYSLLKKLGKWPEYLSRFEADLPKFLQIWADRHLGEDVPFPTLVDIAREKNLFNFQEEFGKMTTKGARIIFSRSVLGKIGTDRRVTLSGKDYPIKVTRKLFFSNPSAGSVVWYRLDRTSS